MKAETILQHLDMGAVLVAVRHHPMPRKFVLRHPDNKDTGRDGAQEEVSENIVIKLVNKGWVKPAPKDALWDTIQYDLTANGAQIARTTPEPKRGAR